MKRNIILTLLLALCLPFFAVAQSPEGRLPKTVVADVLAQMPAQNQDIYNRMMADLVGSGAEGIGLLTGMMQPTADNTAASYAIGGLTFYVTAAGREADRALVAASLISALEKSSDRELKAFYIRQLQVAGKDDAVPVLKKYATDPSLSTDAVMALTEIGTPAAKVAIESVIETIPNKGDAAKAVGDNELSAKEDLLISWLDSSDAALQRSVLYGLSRAGGEKSLAPLSAAAKKVGYAYDDSGATAAYIILLGRLPIADSGKDLNTLLKSADPSIRSAAIAALAPKEGAAVLPKVLKAMDDPSRPYRNAALKATDGLADAAFLSELTAKLKKAKDQEVVIDIVNYLGDSKVSASEAAIIPYLNSTDATVRKSAIAALTKIGGNEGLTAMIALIRGTDEAAVGDVRDALMWHKSALDQPLTAALAGASESGQVAIIKVLSARHATSAVEAILNLTSGPAKVSKAAYKALANVSTEAQLGKLCSMLEVPNCKHACNLQAAIGSVLATMPADKALAAISPKMNGNASLYYPTLSYIGSPAALAIVKDGVAAADKSAIETVIKWPTPDAIDVLYNIFSNKSLTSHHNAALASYIALIGKTDANDTQKLLLLRRAIDKAGNAAQSNMLLTEIGKLDVFNALLLAGNYLSTPDTEQAAGTALMGIAIRDKDYAFYGPDVERIMRKFLEIRKGGDAPYDKAAIAKYLAEAPAADKGFAPIFNGRDLSGWKGLVKDPVARAKMSAAEMVAAQAVADEEMRNGWEVRNGILYFTGKGNNLCTTKKYGDFEMYVDWQIEPDGDAGIYLRGAPQVQIWDTTRRDVGAEVGSGGLYNNLKNPSKPLVLADNAIGDWNTFYIKMVGERVTVKLNGQLVVDNVILENYWDRGIPIYPEEALELQAHGTLVGYRDIYVKELPKVEPFRLSAEEQKAGFKVLFDGVSMNEWMGNTQDYVTENGTISLYPGNGGGGNLYSKKEYSDFIFRFEFQLTPAANNGLGIRTPMEGDAAYVGTELQILDSEHPVYKDLEIYQYHGSAYGIIPAKRGFLKPTGEWNYQEVVLKGNDLKITLNGTVILEGNLAEASKNGTMDHKDHPGLKNTKGHIAFLGHGSPVKFRNIRIKELK